MKPSLMFVFWTKKKLIERKKPIQRDACTAFSTLKLITQLPLGGHLPLPPRFCKLLLYR